MSPVTTSIIYMVISFLMVVVNIPLLSIILIKPKNRERREFLFMAGMALGDVVYALGFYLWCTRRLEMYADPQGSSMIPRSSCVIEPPILLFLAGITLIGQMNLMTALDRFLATHFAVWYYRQDYVYTYITLAIHYLFCVGVLITNLCLVLLTDTSTEPIRSMCLLSQSLYPGARNILTYYRWSCIGASIVMYIMIALNLRQRSKKQRQNNAPVLSKHISNKMIKNNITMGMTMMNTIAFILVPDVLIYLKVGTTSSNVRMFYYGMILTKTAANFFTFVLRNKELRGIITGSMSKSQT